MIKSIACLLVILQLAGSSLILLVTSSSPRVGSPNTITVVIKTSATITLLDFTLSNQFNLATPACVLNSTSTPCSLVSLASTSTSTIRLTGLALLSGTTYTITFTATNPPYADSFVIQASNSGISFINTGTLTISPNLITCSMSSSSPIVGASATAQFSIGVNTLSTGSTGSISILVDGQDTFPNVLNPSPICLSGNSTYPCSLTLIFGQQILTVSNVPVGKRSNGGSLSISVNSIRNPPFNSTFVICA